MHTILTIVGIWFALSVVLGLCVGRAIAYGSRSVIVAACVASASPVAAQERPPAPDWPAYSVMVAGNVADIWTTHQAFSRGAQEGNGLTSTQRIGSIAISKACAVFAVGMTMRLIERHGHPRIAKAVGWFDGSVTFGAALHNHRIAR